MKQKITIFALCISSLVWCAHAWAQPGTEIAQVNLPVQGFGVSVAADCDGNIYYTNNGQYNLYVMDKNGVLLDTLPTVDSSTGENLDFDEMAYDVTRGILWAQLHGSDPVEVYHIDPSTGIATHQWTSATNSLGTFRDGIAYDASDDSIWISGDVSETIEHYQSDGTYIGSITPQNASGGTLGTISGILVGVGDLMYLGRNGLTEIVQVRKSDGSFIGSFASPGGVRDEGLECDPINFNPTLALWSRDTENFMEVIEIEEGTCTCGGGAIAAPIDIKPSSCPNPLQFKSKGVLPVAIAGTDAFDVSEIDLTTVLLEGVAPLRWSYEDAATPFEPDDGNDRCLECTTEGADGYLDLVLKFNKQEIIAALGYDPADGACILLHLEGSLLDGTLFVGSDVVRVQNK